MSFSKKHGADHSRVDRVQRGARITENAPGAYAAKDRERSVNGTDQLTHYDRSLKMARPERDDAQPQKALFLQRNFSSCRAR
jgi:hypothetical protein